MKSPAQLWNAYRLAKSSRALPSQIFHLDDPVDAFCFDRAVLMFGDALQGELDGVEEKTKQAAASKQKAILRRWIPEAPSDFQDPAKLGSLNEFI